MELQMKIACFWMVVVLFLSNFFSSYSFSDYSFSSSISKRSRFDKYEYTRYPEVRRECSSILSSASQPEYDRHLGSLIRRKLSFYDGEWKQDTDVGKPLLPMPKLNATETPIHSVSFSVLDVEKDHGSPLVMKVAGFLNMLIHSKYRVLNRSYDHLRTPEFEFMPGSTSLSIIFEGIYVESGENGGEHIVCLLGKTSIPLPKSDSSLPENSSNASRTSSYEFSLLQDDKIRIVLRYPKLLSLTSREAHGEVTSLHEPTDPLYFEKINLVSLLEGSYFEYRFGSEKLISKVCTPYPYPNKLVSDEITIFKVPQVCELLQNFAAGPFSILPNWNCNSSAVDYCNRLGPFSFADGVGETNGSSLDAKIYMQDVRCEAQPAQGNVGSARISAVFRATSGISGFDNMVLAVEGNWSSDSGQLCMVGCLGPDDKSCDARVLIYFPNTFTISQRNAIIGSISDSNVNGGARYYPLSLRRMVQPWELQTYSYLSLNISYHYTKIQEAGSFLERNKKFDFITRIKKSLLKYPKAEPGDETFSLSRLAEDLTFGARIVTDSSVYTGIEMNIYRIGSFLGSSRNLNSSTPEQNRPVEIKESELLLNVSALLTFSGENKKHFSNISNLLLEGLYDPVDGKMYLIGCRDARAPLEDYDSLDLENGMDCLIEVKVEYPPVMARWLVSQIIKISISSQRNDDSVLHFDPIPLQTFPITYRNQRDDILSLTAVEGILQSLVLSLATACIFSQLAYIRKDTSVPFISMVMLGVLALGYSLPLIGGAKTLLFGRKSKSHDSSMFYLQDNQFMYLVNFLVKILFLVAFLLILRLLQKVWKSRKRLMSRVTSDSRHVPNDKWVFFTCLCIHIVGFLVVVSVNAVSRQPNKADMVVGEFRHLDQPIAVPISVEGYVKPTRGWSVELEEYLGMVQDFFLLPQVIGNLLWQLDGKPLRKAYYMGLTILRILPHVYDSMKPEAPTLNSYGMEEGIDFVNPSMDFYSRFGDIAIPVIASLLAISVYCQQKWNFQKLCQFTGLTRVKIPSLGRKSYERLPTVVPESELAGLGANEDGSRI